MEDTTAQKMEIKSSWKVNGSKISSMGSEDALISLVIVISEISKMDSEMRLDNTTFLMETFMTAVGKWIKGTDTGHFLRKNHKKLILDFGKMEE